MTDNQYSYKFYKTFKAIMEVKEWSNDVVVAYKNDIRPLFSLEDDRGRVFANVRKHASVKIIELMKEIVNCLMDEYGHEHIEPSIELDGFSCIRIEDGLMIAYKFVFRHWDYKDYERILKENAINRIVVVALAEIDENDEIEREKKYWSRKNEGRVQFITIKELFELFNDEEYQKFKEHVEKFGFSLRNQIGYGTVLLPSSEMLELFKKEEIERILDYDYAEFTRGILEKEISIIKNNFFERQLYRSLVGDSNFAESFLGAEWYYHSFAVTSGIEQTAIIVGYLKAVEQLLFEIIKLTINSGFKIHRKNDYKPIDFTTENLKEADLTLGSMISYLNNKRHAKRLWDVNSYVRKHICKMLNEYRSEQRNDHLHKDNVFSLERITEIRNHTFGLLYLILGGCKITDENASKLKLYSDQVLNISESIKDWIDRFNSVSALDHSKALFAWVLPGQIVMSYFSGIDENGIPFGVENFFADDVFKYNNDSAKEISGVLVEVMKDYLQNGFYSEEMKKHPLIAVGTFAEPVMIYKK